MRAGTADVKASWADRLRRVQNRWTSGASVVLLAFGLAIAPFETRAANETYTYDNAGRLITVDHGDGRTTTYTLDPAGNRTNVKTELAGSPGTLSIVTGSATYAESQGTVSVVIRRSGGVTGAASVGVSLTTSASDATVAPASVNWLNGESADKSVTVTIVNDTVLESIETFNLNISGPGGATLGTPASITFTINDDDQTETTPPTAPTNLAATAVSGTQINLSWTASSDASGISQYRIERCAGAGCSSYAQIATTTSTGFSDSGLSEITSYSYQVRAVDGVNNVGPYSSAVTRGTLDVTGPTAPGSFTATAVNATRVDLSWTASSDNVGVSGYRVERCGGTTSCPTYSQIGTTANNVFTFSDTTTTQVTSYQYRTYAVDAVPNAGAYSAVAPVTTPDGTAPSVPTGLGATVVSPNRIDLSWSASSDNVGVAGYTVYRNGSPVSNTTATSYVDDVLQPSTSYTYQVLAYDGAGNQSGLSASAGGTTQPLPDTTPPTVPSTLNGTVISSSQIDLTWVASTDTGGSGLAGYRLYRNGGLLATLAATAAPTLAYSDTTTSGTTTYNYVVYAYDNANNQSAASNTRTLTTTDTIAPTQPTGLTATAVNGNTINLSWTGSTDQGGSSTFYYWVTRNGVQLPGSIQTPTTTWQDTSATAGATFTYTVVARDIAGNSSPPSNTASATTPNLLSASVSRTSWLRFVAGNGNVTGGGTVTTTASGGSGGYTYLWERLTTDIGSIAATAYGNATTSFTLLPAQPAETSYSSTWRCKVTDSSNAVVYTPIVTVTFTRAGLN